MASDDFNRADNASSLGANWTAQTGTWGINTNAAFTSTSGAMAYWSAASFNSDQSSECVVTNPSGQVWFGPAVRCQSGALSCYSLYEDSNGGTFTLSKFVGGAETILGTSSQTFSSPDTLKVDATGTTITPTVNGAGITGLAAQSDAALSGGSPGLYATDAVDPASRNFDNWVGTGDAAADASLRGTWGFFQKTRRPAPFKPGLIR